MSHAFAIGQTVTLLPLRLRQSAPGDYEVLRLLPEGRYRIKSVDEKHERVVGEDEIGPSSKDVFSATPRRHALDA